MESLDAYYAIQDASGAIIAGAGIAGDVIKCLAVDQEYRSEGLLVPLISRILALRGGAPAKVFTKPEYQAVFESMGFHLLASSSLAILLENGRGLQMYCDYLRAQALPGRCGVVVMNANPFTLGHRYLLEQASAQVDHLYVIPVKEDVSEFPYAERLAMIQAGAPDNVHVLQGSEYVISSATFPTYFLKDLSKAAETHMALDLDLYNHWIAPALGASVRFVGSEPFDALTNHYNTLIPNAVIIPRYQNISASRVRKALAGGHFSEAASMCPESTWPYLMAALAQRALQRELDTPGKPGLVGPDGPGAHKDMDYSTMMRGIRALRPYWSRMATALSADDLRSLGIEAEKAMLVATGGVNTHRGAIFALGLALNAVWCGGEVTDNEQFISSRVHLQVHRIFGNSLNNNDLRATGIKSARKMAEGGYSELFEDWLPFYAENGELKTLLHIMSTLDDTCVIKRVGQERAQKVKREAAEASVMPHLIGQLCERYAAEGISPGGAADMLALTIFIDSIIS
ncbi:MAG: triphosphoribosyl-dephospho-CoA synthase [Bacteroidales bacterium]|nr:triphosphoribosyl-dephospho-CoA synthase [Bacteroidales bacterium]